MVGRLTGRALQVPDGAELVAFGAAVQAAAVLRGEDPDAVAQRWGGARGMHIDPVQIDEERLARVRAAIALEPGVDRGAAAF